MMKNREISSLLFGATRNHLQQSGLGNEAGTEEAQCGVQGEGGVSGDQGRPDDRRTSRGVRGPPEPDLQLEEATAGRCGERLRGRRFGGGVYRKPAEVSAEDLAIMTVIDRQYLARPYYGSHRMAAWLAAC